MSRYGFRSILEGGRRLHPAWIVLAASMVGMAVSGGIRDSFPVFIDPLVQRFEWNRGDISFAYALVWLANIPLLLVAGRLADRWGARTLLLGGAAFSTLGVVLTGRIAELWQLHVAWGLLAGGIGSSVFMLLPPVVVGHWFRKKLGLAMGLTWVAMSLGQGFVPLVFYGLMTAYGWQDAFLLVGLGSGVALSVSSYFSWGRPSAKGVLAYGESASATATTRRTQRQAPASPHVPFRALWSMPAFKRLTFIHLFGCASHSVILSQVVAMATFRGVGAAEAAGLVTTLFVTSLASRLGLSLLADKLGGKKVLLIGLLAQTVPLFLLWGAQDAWQFYIFAVLFGIGFGGEMVVYPIINRQYYGKEAPHATMYSFQLAGAVVGMAAGGWMGGALFDLSGAYTWSVTASLAAGVMAVAIILGLPAVQPGAAPAVQASSSVSEPPSGGRQRQSW